MCLIRRVPCSMLLLAVVLSTTGCKDTLALEGPGKPAASPAHPTVYPLSQPTAETPTLASGWKREEIPFDYSVMKEDVRIQLDGDPRLHSPLRTAVGTAPQAYTFFFRESMDRSSVEEAIRRHAKATENGRYIQPDLSFHWAHDRQLHVLATLPSPLEPEARQEYVLNAGGAKTAKGSAIRGNSAFHSVVTSPNQVWRISLDGGQREKLTDFSDPYKVANVLDADNNNLLLYRYWKLGEYDDFHAHLYTVYDRGKQTYTRYPVKLAVNYRGEGAFVADRRGFFYALPEKGTELPASEFSVPVRVDGFVHGASFSKDRKSLLMAVGAAEQKKDLDLVILDLEAGTKKTILRALKGTTPTDEGDDVALPIRFDDDGRYATFYLWQSEEKPVEIRQRYDWKSGKVVSWNPPVPKDSWSGYVQSDDGKYQMYWSVGLHQGSSFIWEPDGTALPGLWLPGTHQYVYTKLEGGTEGTPSSQSIHLFDADRKQDSELFTGLPAELKVIGVSEDGKWLYVQSGKELEPGFE